MTPIKNNLMDVLVLLLKAQLLASGKREVRLSKAEVMPAENFDLEMGKGMNGDIVLRLKNGKGGTETAIVLPPDAPLITF